MSSREAKPYLFKNPHGGIQDLGIKGEYPWSSSVGRRYILGQTRQIIEIWYETEINARGELGVDHNCRFFKQYLEGDRSSYVLEVIAHLGFKVNG